MGERKGVNKYYPPDFDYKKHGSLDRYHNSHPLRERARKLKTEGILIIRFEMPYNIWCNGCNKHIGMGVRYNAEKKKMGNYYSTPIYKFRMKCHLCEQHFEIQTDPANCDYVILSGARRKEERWDAKANEQIEMTDYKDKQELLTNPMFKLEHSVKDKHKLQTVIPTLSEIQDLQDEKRDDYLLNKALRKTFREQKRKIERVQERDNKLLAKSSLNIPLVEETEEDIKLSKLIKYSTVTSYDTKRSEVREKIINESIFSSSTRKQNYFPNPKILPKQPITKIHFKELSKNHGMQMLKRKISPVKYEASTMQQNSSPAQMTEHKSSNKQNASKDDKNFEDNFSRRASSIDFNTSFLPHNHKVFLVANYSSDDEL